MHSLTSSLDGGEWSALRPGRFTLSERAPDIHWIGSWVGPRTVLDAVVKRKIPSLRQESNPRTPIIQHYTDWAITALFLPRVVWENAKCELHDWIGAAECITSDMLANTWQETDRHLDVCCATNGAHIETCWACKKICGAHCLKVHTFLQYTIWLMILYVLFYCHLRLDIVTLLS